MRSLKCLKYLVLALWVSLLWPWLSGSWCSGPGFWYFAFCPHPPEHPTHASNDSTCQKHQHPERGGGRSAQTQRARGVGITNHGNLKHLRNLRNIRNLRKVKNLPPPIHLETLQSEDCSQMHPGHAGPGLSLPLVFWARLTCILGRAF